MTKADELSVIIDQLPSEASDSGEGNTSSIDRALRTIRTHLGMEVAYVSRFVDNNSVFREVDAPGLEHLIQVGDTHSLDDVYCRHILNGRLPKLMPDTSAEPFAKAMPITDAVPIGKHMSIPLKLSDGSVYGMFCCLGPAPDATLTDRDLRTMNVFAEFTAFEIEREIEAERTKREKREQIIQAIDEKRLAIRYQPIYQVNDHRPVGFECLSRFQTEPYQPPNVWFQEAADVALGEWLEKEAIKAALPQLKSIHEKAYLALNASPETVMSADFAKVFDNVPHDRIVLEITEHAHVSDYASLNLALSPLRRNGIRLAVDDAGSGYSSLQHIIQLKPDIIKLDISLTANVDKDPMRYALASALISFARTIGCEIVAEGIETKTELAALKALGVHKVQGYYLAKPMEALTAAALLPAEKSLVDAF